MSSSRYTVFATRMALTVFKARLKGATKGHSLLKRKSDALKIKFRKIIKDLVENKSAMGDQMREANFSLTKAKYSAGDFSDTLKESIELSSRKVRIEEENVAGVKLPIFKSVTDGIGSNLQLIGLGLDGHMDIFQSATRYAPGCRKSATRQGNLDQVILVGMKVKKVESNFPCQLGLTMEGAKGNFYTCNGERYAYLIGSNEKSHKLDEVIVTTNPYVNSEYLRLYPGMTSDKLRTEGIMAVPGENYVFVDKDHPIVEMMNENQEVLQIDLNSAQLIDNRWYKVSQAVTERCISELENELVDNLPLMSFNKFNASITRLYGREWDDEEEVCDNVTSRETRSKVMTNNRRVTVVVQVTYAYM